MKNKENMKKLECLVSEEKIDNVEKVCQKEGYTRAEFLRRAIDNYLITKKNVTEIADAVKNATINVIIEQSKSGGLLFNK